MKFDASIVQTSFESPLGTIRLAATRRGLAGLWFEGQRHWPAELDRASALSTPSLRPAVWPTDSGHPVLQETSRQLADYFAGRRLDFELPLDLDGGTAFQQLVWRALRAIPTGGTASYSEISARIGQPTAVRAVGAAVGRNPVSIVVPCHRVLGADGSLTGYAGGLHRKTALLELEGVLQKAML